MSAKLIGQVWALDLPANEQCLLLALMDHAENNGANSNLTDSLLVWKLGVSKIQLKRIKKSLERKGVLIFHGFDTQDVGRYQVRLKAGHMKPPFASSDDAKLSQSGKWQPDGTRFFAA